MIATLEELWKEEDEVTREKWRVKENSKAKSKKMS